MEINTSLRVENHARTQGLSSLLLLVNIHVHTYELGILLKFRFLESTPRDSDSVGLDGTRDSDKLLVWEHT